MSQDMRIHYDEEADFLEISIGKPVKGFFKDTGNDIFQRVDESTNKVVGIAIFNFKKRVEAGKDVELILPFKVDLPAAL